MPKYLIKIFKLLSYITILLPLSSIAADGPNINSGDTAWIITASAFVLLMLIPGLALFYAGMVKKENVLAVATQSFVTGCVICVLWVIIGYSLVFTEGNCFIGGLSYLFLSKMTVNSISSIAPTIPESVFVIFQMTFAAITPALMLGSVADRLKFSSMIVVVIAWSLVVYVPIAHWLWGPNGLLGSTSNVLGFGPVLDYAGGLVVHVSSGFSALVLILIMGNRKSKLISETKPYNLLFSLIGAALLWVGWTGFNAGSAVSSGANAGMAMLVSYVSASIAALSWMFVEWKHKGKPSVVGVISGSIVGLVAITPSSGFVGLDAALVIGIVSGISCYIACTSLKAKLGYDDSLDAFGVHGVAGVIGTVLTGVFAAKEINNINRIGGLLEGNVNALFAQIAGVVIVIIYTLVMSFIIFKIIDKIMGLRTKDEVETKGLDHHLHGNVIN